ncbi:hypothetical protein HF325_004466 [Metschnikowia pulcherrima]|uniref:Uncharacterized protein n=1 Tax=Metschnikowia pulcherrima TaxID=27326 RepID=A0A8H7GPF7_9ASCO|nr:hypothetical protein HF325_004466 [Metschnikowia pulcherrima]
MSKIPVPSADVVPEIGAPLAGNYNSDGEHESHIRTVSSAGLEPNAIDGTENHADIERHYTQRDADSLVGGQSVNIDSNNDEKETGLAPGHEFFGQKVFLFSLPFGGLSLIRSGFQVTIHPP